MKIVKEMFEIWYTGWLEIKKAWKAAKELLELKIDIRGVQNNINNCTAASQKHTPNYLLDW